MVVTMPAASHTSRECRGRRSAGGAGSGGMARPLADTVRRGLLCTPPPARNNRRESRERAMQQQTDAIRGAVTQRRQPELNADTVCCRPSWGFLPFSLAGRATRSVHRSTTRAHALLLHPAPHHRHTTAPRFACNRLLSTWFITYRLPVNVNFVWLVNIHEAYQRRRRAHVTWRVWCSRGLHRNKLGPRDCSIAALF